MNKYDIKIGDCVETTDGAIDFIAVANGAVFSVIFTKDGSNFKSSNNCAQMFSMTVLNKKENPFRQVGVYQFDKISLIDKFPTSNFNINSIAIKLNELIDHVNAIQERLAKENKQ